MESRTMPEMEPETETKTPVNEVPDDDGLLDDIVMGAIRVQMGDLEIDVDFEGSVNSSDSYISTSSSEDEDDDQQMPTDNSEEATPIVEHPSQLIDDFLPVVSTVNTPSTGDDMGQPLFVAPKKRPSFNSKRQTPRGSGFRPGLRLFRRLGSQRNSFVRHSVLPEDEERCILNPSFENVSETESRDELPLADEPDTLLRAPSGEGAVPLPTPPQAIPKTKTTSALTVEIPVQDEKPAVDAIVPAKKSSAKTKSAYDMSSFVDTLGKEDVFLDEENEDFQPLLPRTSTGLRCVCAKRPKRHLRINASSGDKKGSSPRAGRKSPGRSSLGSPPGAKTVSSPPTNSTPNSFFGVFRGYKGMKKEAYVVEMLGTPVTGFPMSESGSSHLRTNSSHSRNSHSFRDEFTTPSQPPQVQPLQQLQLQHVVPGSFPSLQHSSLELSMDNLQTRMYNAMNLYGGEPEDERLGLDDGAVDTLRAPLDLQLSTLYEDDDEYISASSADSEDTGIHGAAANNVNLPSMLDTKQVLPDLAPQEDSLPNICHGDSDIDQSFPDGGLEGMLETPVIVSEEAEAPNDELHGLSITPPKPEIVQDPPTTTPPVVDAPAEQNELKTMPAPQVSQAAPKINRMNLRVDTTPEPEAEPKIPTPAIMEMAQPPTVANPCHLVSTKKSVPTRDHAISRTFFNPPKGARKISPTAMNRGSFFPGKTTPQVESAPNAAMLAPTANPEKPNLLRLFRESGEDILVRCGSGDISELTYEDGSGVVVGFASSPRHTLDPVIRRPQQSLQAVAETRDDCQTAQEVEPVKQAPVAMAPSPKVATPVGSTSIPDKSSMGQPEIKTTTSQTPTVQASSPRVATPVSSPSTPKSSMDQPTVKKITSTPSAPTTPTIDTTPWKKPSEYRKKFRQGSPRCWSPELPADMDVPDGNNYEDNEEGGPCAQDEERDDFWCSHYLETESVSSRSVHRGGLLHI
eukprot:Nitzschia sp. Nitz4//scaffold95_size97785//86041//88935//NITZ4_004680-RA/size97785-processed-gene-0.91-mRNA-1//-1//CDS//3329560511//6274//frame0